MGETFPNQGEASCGQSEAGSAVKLAYRTQPEKWLEFGIKAKK